MDEATIKQIKQRATDFMVGYDDGLWLRIRTTGRKAFIVRRKQGGKSKIITLGDWPVLSFKVAKLMAATVKTPSDSTVNDLLKQYHEAVISRHARPKQFATYAERIRAAMGMVRVSEVSAKRLAELVAESRPTPRSADSLRSHLKAMFSLAIGLGWRDDNPAAVIGARVTGYKYEPITRVLTHDDIKQLWAWEGNNSRAVAFSAADRPRYIRRAKRTR